MTFRKARTTTKVASTNAQNLFENRPKIHSESLPEPLQNDPQKNNAKKNNEKSPKVAKMTFQMGAPGGPSNVVFGHVIASGRPWGPTWLPDLPPELPRPLRILIFDDFGSPFGSIFA